MLFFKQFPKIFYSLDGGSPIIITNILARVKLREFVKNAGFVYYTYQIKDGDTPETIAHKYYGDPTREWLIFLANENMIDPNYDWPLPYDVFQNYITGKYGSVATAMSGIHHYEKKVVQIDSASLVSTTKIYQIDATTYGTLPTGTTTINLANGTTVTQVVSKDTVTNYEYEDALNEAKRNINLLDKKYVSEVEAEFKALMS